MDLYLFSDEAGDFTFNRNQNVSRYFIICTLTTENLSLGAALTRLRHELVWEGLPVADCFHATSDTQAVRDRVYAELMKHDFRFQATICEKSKAQPQVTRSKARFYQYPWYYHFKFGISRHVRDEDRLMVTAASIGSRRERESYLGALRGVMRQNLPRATWAVDFRPAMADPMLQAADYCAWAVQRAWERGDTRALDPLRDRFNYEYDLWSRGQHHHY